MEDIRDLDNLEKEDVNKILEDALLNYQSEDRTNEAFTNLLAKLDAAEREKLEGMIAKREKMVEAKENVSRFFQKPADFVKAGHDKLDAYKQLRQARQEIVLAKTNGFDTKRLEDVVAKYEAANRLYQEKADAFKETKGTLLDSISDRFGKIGKFVNEQFEKVANWLDDKRASVMAAVISTKEAVELANGRFTTERDTAYVGLNEKVASVERAWMQVNYSIDNKIVNVLDNVYEKLQEHYQQKQAIKDIKQGAKEVNVGDVAVTGSKQNILETIKTWSKGYKEEMSDLKKDFELSKEISIYNIKSNQELRESYGMKTAPSLEADMKKATAAAIEQNTNRSQGAPKLEEQNVSKTR